MKKHPSVLILGAGYVGATLAAAIQKRSDADLKLWVRSEKSARSFRAAGYATVVGDVSNSDAWAAIGSDTFDVIIQATSSGRGGAEAYQSVFISGFRESVRKQPKARKIFISSTSVYGQQDGSIVTEASPAEPKSETSRILRRAEDLALIEQATVLRVSGIYGPGRSIYMKKLHSGEASIPGNGSRLLNQIHRDDVVKAILHTIDHPETEGQIFNVTDNSHPSLLQFYEWLSHEMKLPMPSLGASETSRKRGITNKRVSNAKLMATGWRPRYPTYQDGYRTVLTTESSS